MNDIFWSFPNYVDAFLTDIFVLFLMACGVLVLEVCVWVLVKLGIAIYRDLREGVRTLGV